MTFEEDHINAIVKVLKSHFNNLKVEEVLAIAFEILRAIAKEERRKKLK